MIDSSFVDEFVGEKVKEWVEQKYTAFLLLHPLSPMQLMQNLFMACR